MSTKPEVRGVPQGELLFPSAPMLARVASARAGDLRSVPFANLLLALDQQKSTCSLEVRRKHVRKSILIENGVPVQCRSNVLHNTFGFYLREIGLLTANQYTEYSKESLDRQVPIGEVLLAHGILNSEQILVQLQKLLAKVILDVFAWTDGTFLIVQQMPKIQAPLKLRVGQLILTGVSRFSPQVQVDRATGSLGDARLSAYEGGRSRNAKNNVDRLRLSDSDRAVVEALRREPLSFRELTTLLPFDRATVRRSVYALSLLGLIDPTDRLKESVATEEIPDADGKPTRREPEELTRRALSNLYLDHRRVSSAQLLGVDEGAEQRAVNEAFIVRAQTLTPLSLGDDPRAASQARDLLLATAKAFVDLSTPEVSRVAEASPPRSNDEGASPSAAELPRLLDPAEHYSQGLEQMESGDYGTALSNLELASDSSPQRGLYRAQAAYCLFLKSSKNAGEALNILTDTHRLDPTCGLAFLYAGEIYTAQDRFQDAEKALRTASKLMAPDRRPIEKLRELRQLERALKTADSDANAG